MAGNKEEDSSGEKEPPMTGDANGSGEEEPPMTGDANGSGEEEPPMTGSRAMPCSCCDACFHKVKTAISGLFHRYGEVVGRHPLPFIVLPILLLGGLGAGMVALDEESDLETVYFPKDSAAMQDRQYVRDTFTDLSDVNYNPFSLSDTDNAATIIFQAKGPGGDIFAAAVLAEITSIVVGVESLNTSGGKTYSDFCARSSGACVVDGKIALDPNFQTQVAAKHVTYPINGVYNLETSISGQTLEGGDKLVSASVLKVSFKLAEDAEEWKGKFLQYLDSQEPSTLEVAYETPDSLNQELDKSTKGDIVFFSLTITLVCTYASVVSSGGNPVSTRGLLAFAGILAAGLGIVGSMGLMTLCGVKFVNIVGVIPFLIIGIGVDDMFLIMSSWSENLPENPDKQNVKHVPSILGKTLASAGIGITITSVTDFLAFVIGTTSVFRSVTNFSLYAGVAVLFCYLANVTMFSGCLAIHGRRVYSWRHSFTCQKTKSRTDLEKDGRSKCFAVICGGNPPKNERDDESVCEMLPSRFLPFIIKNWIVSIVIIILFLVYLAVSIYGITNLKQGLVLQDLVLENSYYHKFLTLSDEYFPTRIPLGFVVKETRDYSGNGGILFQNLLQKARADSSIDDGFERCWLTSYKASAGYSTGTFISGLPAFLNTNPDFAADVVMDSAKTEVQASRCFVYSKPTIDQYANAELMERMRELAGASPLQVFAFHSSFVAFEQFLAVLPATLQMVGSAVAVMTVVTFLFLPHILMVLLVVLTIIMILVGIFGFLYFWDLTLSSITMIHLVMSVGFSVDFSAHVCAAYLLSDKEKRMDRASDAIRHAAGPILNGAISTLLGVLVLVLSSSYIFQSFFKVMFLVIVFGLLHAVFFLPAVLSLVGPQNQPSGNKVAVAPIAPPSSPVYSGPSASQHTNGTAGLA